MKIRLDNINQPYKQRIAGTEEWLKPIYESFGTPNGQKSGVVVGEVTVLREGDEFFKISGRLDYVPWVDCSRCGDLIPWDVSGKFNCRIIPEHMDTFEESTGERSFTYTDDDVLTHSGWQFDLAEFVNDQIQLAIPFQTVNRTDDGKDCRDCGRSLSDDRVHIDDESPAAGAGKFDVLRKLKLQLSE